MDGRPTGPALVLALLLAGGGSPPRWHPLPPEGSPEPREAAASVWTGRELIVWGGYREEKGTWPPRFLATGGRYDPAARRWRPLPAAGAPAPRAWHSAVWTGGEMIVWGGEAGEPTYGDGAAYDPEGDRWRPLSMEGAPSPRVEHAAVWTGTEMIVFGGVTDEASFVDGGRYDPAADAWRPLARADFLVGPRAMGAVWTGREMVVWGGINGGRVLRQGGRYDPEEDAWRPVSAEGAPSARGYPGIAWTGDRVAVFGGTTGVLDAPGAPGGALYDPGEDRWTPLPAEGAPSPRRGHVVAWTGKALLVWDGTAGSRAGFPGDGAAWSPGGTAWTPLPRAGAPAARAGAAAAWTGEGLLFWGGAGDVPFADGGYLAPPREAAGGESHRIIR